MVLFILFSNTRLPSRNRFVKSFLYVFSSLFSFPPWFLTAMERNVEKFLSSFVGPTPRTLGNDSFRRARRTIREAWDSWKFIRSIDRWRLSKLGSRLPWLRQQRRRQLFAVLVVYLARPFCWRVRSLTCTSPSGSDQAYCPVLSSFLSGHAPGETFSRNLCSWFEYVNIFYSTLCRRASD